MWCGLLVLQVLFKASLTSAHCRLLAVKDSSEKDTFFKKLPATIPAIPEPVAVRKILPLLSRALEYGGAPASAVGSLMLIGR